MNPFGILATAAVAAFAAGVVQCVVREQCVAAGDCVAVGDVPFCSFTSA